jgi:hypothetical protein
MVFVMKVTCILHLFCAMGINRFPSRMQNLKKLTVYFAVMVMLLLSKGTEISKSWSTYDDNLNWGRGGDSKHFAGLLFLQTFVRCVRSSLCT